MKRKKISEAIENINPKYIDEAADYKKKEKLATKTVQYKWVAVAACFVIALAAAIPVVNDFFVSSDDKDILVSALMIEYEGAYLEIVEKPKTIEKYGLEEKITPKIIGNHIAYLQKRDPEAEHSDYIVAAGETDLELLEYSPAPYKAVRIFRDGEKYCFALFLNYLAETNESLPIETAFEVYGIDDAADIVSITPVRNSNSWKPKGKAITDGEVISEFFNEISKLSDFCFNDYHDLVFANELKKLEEKGGDIGAEAYIRVADDVKYIVIETGEGLRFAVEYYPSYGWIYVSAAMSYYKMTSEISEWLSAYAE